MEGLIIVWFLVAMVTGLIAQNVAKDKAMDLNTAWTYGFFLGIIGIIIVSLGKSKEKAELERLQLEELRKKNN